MDSALSVRDLSLNIGGAKILDGITLEVAHNETLGIIGPNGAGKTSFFNLLSGIRKPSRGQIFVGDTDVTDLSPHERALSGIARTFQTSSVFINLTCLENVRIAAQAANGKSMNLTKNAYKFPEVVALAHDCLAKVGLSARALQRAGSLSHGDKRRLEIAIVLASKSDIVLLDEPMAGMSVENVVSVGKYATLYNDFDTYVQSYFGRNGGFSTLFHRYQLNNSVFDAAAFMNFITGDASNNFSVSITVGNINNLLRFAVDSNCFGNRIDPSGVKYGFIANDIIWVPQGTSIKLNLDIDAESFTPINNRGPIYANTVGISQDNAFTSGNFVETTQSTTTNISRVLVAPLLIRLV